jgi:hypothetical protein
MANEYTSLTEVKRYISTGQSTDDTLLQELITDCSREIDTYCQRQFYGTTATRYFDAEQDVTERTLFLDEDLQSVSALVNGDGETLSGSTYLLQPPNDTPKYAIKLKSSSSKSWTWYTDPENAISVTGVWGYVSGTVPPEDIKRACIRLVAWRYKQKSAPFETTGLADLGQVVVPSAMPVDVVRMLKPYVRLDFKAV